MLASAMASGETKGGFRYDPRALDRAERRFWREIWDSVPAGIASEHLGRIFDRYWQSADGSRARGTGLGLSIEKGIVDAHGGKIWVESRVGEGSTFSFSVPRAGASNHSE